jgi:hypothetical protein
MHRKVLAGALVAGAAFAAVPAAANAAVICRYNPAQKVTQITLDGVATNVALARSNSNIVFRADASLRNLPCRDIRGEISSTVTNTDQIVIRGTEIDESFTIDLKGGAFAPGAAPEASGTPEIELVLTTSAGRDQLSILGGATNDTLRVGQQGSALLTGDSDIDLTADYDPNADGGLDIDGGIGDDFVTGRGAPNLGLAGAEFPVSLRGGDGNDTVIDGLGKPGVQLADGENDLVSGGFGNDLLFVDDGKGADFVDGGGGDDKAVTDDAPDLSRSAPDVFARTERVTYTSPAGGLLIGKLKLAARTVTAGAEKTGVVAMSWTHPKAWQRLRTVTVKAYDGAAPVGTITLDPRSDRVTGSGSLELVKRRSSLATKGKTVTAQLAVRTKPSLAAKTLRLDVEAIDSSGKRQLETAAGIIIIKRDR